jgi:fluoroquinolone resistance protein
LVTEAIGVEKTFSGEDWYGEEMVQRVYRGCTFTDVDLTEASTSRCTFEECHFRNVRFNASRHADSAFLRCVFARCNFFEAQFDGCKLTGSQFLDCDLRPLTITGGDWSFVAIVGGKLRGVQIRGTRMREADLSSADLSEAVLSNVDLSGARLEKAILTKADLRGSDLSALNPTVIRCEGALIDADQSVVLAKAMGFRVA